MALPVTHVYDTEVWVHAPEPGFLPLFRVSYFPAPWAICGNNMLFYQTFGPAVDIQSTRCANQTGMRRNS